MQDNYNNPKVSLMNLNTPLFSSGGSPMAFKAVDSAYGVWSTKDVFGTGGNVVELVDGSASPNIRSFTATELTDGTYSSWVVTNPIVRTLYDQKGSNDLFQGFSAIAPKYNASDNSLFFDKSGYFGNYRYLTSSASSDVQSDFSGNATGDAVTFVLNAKDNAGTQSTGTQAVLGVIGSAPTVAINQVTKMLTKNETTNAVGVRMRDDSYVIVDEEHDTALSSSSFENYTGILQRLPIAGVTATGFELFVDGTQEIDENTNLLSSSCTVQKFFLGYSRFNTQVCMAFDRALTDDEITLLNTEINSL